MSHPEQLGFFTAVASRNASLLRSARVVEIGSYDVNGSVRKIFGSASNYVGVDLEDGPGVDVIGFGHELTFPDGEFDAAVSGECFEHDPHWSDTFANMIRMTRAGGLVAFTCASRGRPEHGTRRSDPHESPGTQAVGLDYYRNLTEDDFRNAVNLAADFDDYCFWYLPTSFDLYFAGIRAGAKSPDAPVAALPDSAEVEALKSIMPLPHRIARLPLRAALRLTSPARYQSVVLPYWRTLIKVQDRAAGGRFRRADHQ